MLRPVDRPICACDVLYAKANGAAVGAVVDPPDVPVYGQRKTSIVSSAALADGDEDSVSCLMYADGVPTNPAFKALGNEAEGDFGEEQLNAVLEGLDKCVGSIIEALPVNGLLVVFTCQGDTAEYRRMQASSSRVRSTCL